MSLYCFAYGSVNVWSHFTSLFQFFWETAGASTATQAIPIGIAVGRQRLQETTTSQTTSLQAKDLNRFGLGLADLGKFKIKHFY